MRILVPRDGWSEATVKISGILKELMGQIEIREIWKQNNNGNTKYQSMYGTTKVLEPKMGGGALKS